MVYSVGLILIAGLLGRWLAKAIHLPEIIGMMLVGVFIGPYALGWLDGNFLVFSGDIRTMVFIIILLKAGLMLDTQALRKIGRASILMCFLPATFEMMAYILFAPALLGVTIIEAGIIGAIMGAVSPAVVIPRMTQLIEEGWGTKKGIPQMIIAGASADDIYVVVLFSSLLSLAGGGGFHWSGLLRIPVSIALGMLSGCIIGMGFSLLFDKMTVNGTLKCILLLATSFLLVSAEDVLKRTVPFSGYLAVIVLGVVLLARHPIIAQKASRELSKLWIGAEMFLFVLIGAAIDSELAFKAGMPLVGMIFIGLFFRLLGTWLCVAKTKLSGRERIFVMLAELPKTTAQAAIGGIPLAMGLNCGGVALSAAVLAIFITAPMGALAIDMSHSLCLDSENMKGVKNIMKLRNCVRTRLNPVLALKDYSCTFEEEEGFYICEITVHHGIVLFKHEAYNTVVGGWVDDPGEGQERTMVIRKGEMRTIKFQIEKKYGQKDSVLISNHSYIKPAEFTVKIERS